MTKKEKAEFVVKCKRSQTVVAAFDDKMPDALKAAVIGAAVSDCENSTLAVKAAESTVEAAKEAEKKAFKVLRDIEKRVRSSVKGAFGDDSLEFESVGGKRTSERKRPSRKAKEHTA